MKEQKQCSRCKRWKPLYLFGKAKHQPSRLRSECLKCRDKNSQRIKDRCFEHYGGYICAHCGNTDKEVLTLDHINDDGAEMNKITFPNKKSKHRRLDYRWLVRNHFPLEHKLQVLCANCQLKKEVKRRRKNTKERRSLLKEQANGKKKNKKRLEGRQQSSS